MGGHIIWQAGDRWRRLEVDLARTRQFTVVSRNGTTNAVDLCAGTRRRVSRRDIGVPASEIRPVPCDEVGTATPCGLVLLNRFDWWATARVVLITSGCTLDWTTTGDGRDIVDRLSTTDPHAPHHPDGPCGSVYCENDIAERRIRALLRDY